MLCGTEPTQVGGQKAWRSSRSSLWWWTSALGELLVHKFSASWGPQHGLVACIG